MIDSSLFIICHLWGDYLFQSDWMASTKTKSSWPCFWHAVWYTTPFLVLTQSLWALAFIAGTHFVIDRFRLARYACWVKNWLAPNWIDTKKYEAYVYDPGARESFAFKVMNHPWSECSATGYKIDESFANGGKPMWMAMWLMIIADNTLHLTCNYIALRWLQ